jgi:hypothetical protein
MGPENNPYILALQNKLVAPEEQAKPRRAENVFRFQRKQQSSVERKLRNPQSQPHISGTTARKMTKRMMTNVFTVRA